MFLLTRQDGTLIVTRHPISSYCDEVKPVLFESMEHAIDYATKHRITATVGKVVAVATVKHETTHRVTIDPLL